MQSMMIQAWWLRWRRRLLVVAGLLALYALAGFWLAPKWLRAELIEQAREQTGRKLDIGELRINPFSLELKARQLALQEGDGAVLSIDRLAVDFELSSLWHRALVFREIVIDAPFARAILDADGSLNLARLVKPSQPPAGTKPSNQDLPALWIKHFSVASGALSFADRRSPEGGEKRLSPLAFELFDFRTTAAGGGFHFRAQSESGERFAWKGRLALAPFSSRGTFRVEQLRGATVAGLLGDGLPFTLVDGSIDLHGSYRFSAGEQVKARVRLPEIVLRGLGLRARGLAASPENTWIELPAVRIENSRIYSATRRVRIGAVQIEAPRVQVWREPDGSINLARLMSVGAPLAEAPATPATDASAMPAATGVDSAPAADESAWTFELSKFVLAKARLEWADRSVQPALELQVTPLDLEIAGISQDLSRPLALKLGARIDEHTAFDLSGALAPQPLSGTLQLQLADADLRWLQPYLAGLVDADVRGGRLSGSGELNLRSAPSSPALEFSGDVEINQFASRDRAAQRDLLNWKSLRMAKLAYTQSPDALAIGRMDIDHGYARVAIDEDGGVNLAKALAPTDAGPATPTTANPTPSLPVRIGQVVVRDSRMQFSDFSIEPNFQAEIKGLSGAISGLSSTAATPAKVDLTGYVINPYSPVTIKGSADLFAFDRATDLAFSFHNIDLPVFNPYSGRFAGYSIAKGKLNTDLHYQIDARKLVATHHVSLDQLEWGDATDSKDKVSLPVRMATSLLKNKDGLIDLEVPINGTLDDPKFRVGPLVWKIVRNILVKAVTAPFRFLGGLFKGAEKARHVTFEPGSGQLNEADRGNLGALARALLERPNLRLEVPMAVLPELDRPALIDARWQQQLAEIIASENGNKTDPPTQTFAMAEPKQQRQWLVDLYRSEVGEKPELPEPPPPAEDLDKDARRLLEYRFDIDYLTTVLRARIKVDEEQLAALAQLRADAVQAALLATEGLDPARIFSATDRTPQQVDGRLQIELKLN